MIPKKIHYCWFGRGEKPELAVKCIESWKKFLPDYEIIEWNEDNFNLDRYAYVREAYDARRFAFVTDVVRLWAMYTYGGIYMDTDVEVLKPLDSLLEFEAVSGFEAKTRIQTGLMACREGFPLFKELLDEYEEAHFIKPDGSQDTTTNVIRITNACLRHGFVPNGKMQTVDGFTLLPADYLCPKSLETGKIHLTENSLCIHHFSGSWMSGKYKVLNKLRRCRLSWLVDTLVAIKSFARNLLVRS